MLTREDVAKRVQEMFVPTKEKTQSPMMVMFANERWPMDVLAALGVNTSHWHRGIEPLLRPANSTISVSLYGTGGNVKKERDRSRSPTRMQRTDRMSRRPRSPVHASTSTSSHLMPEDCVFYVDVRSMYATMKKVSLINDFVLDGALDLGVAEVNLDNNLPVDKQTKVWCAGNESRYVLHDRWVESDWVVCTARKMN